MTLFSALARSADRSPQGTALEFRGESTDFATLASQAERFSGALGRLGLKSRPRVGLLLPNCAPFPIAYFGTARAGGTAVPLNVLYRPDELRYILADAEVEAVVTIDPFRPLLAALRPALPSLKRVIVAGEGPVGDDELDFRRLLADAPPASPPRVREDDTAVLIYTSGTTGRPKGAMLSHANIVANAEQCIRAFGVDSSDSILTALPLFHAFAATVCMVLPVVAGARMVPLERFMPAPTLEAIAASRATLFAGVPAMFGIMLQALGNGSYDLSPLRFAISGGAPLPPDVAAGFEAASGVPVVEGYGLTEASPVVTITPPDAVRKPGSIGLPLPGIEVRLLSPAGKPVPPGEPGELCIRGANVMKGYLNRPADTRAAIRSGWLHTGDLVRADADGYLYVAGRLKELIIVGGLNVYPGEVERALAAHPAVMEVAAFGMPDSTHGEVVWAAVVLRPDAVAESDALRAHCREHLASFKVPRRVAIVAELPKNALGKVVRHQIRAQMEAKT